ncbi:pre-rRNA processing [Hypoxylon texense]
MAAQGRSIIPLRSLTLDLPPSCIEFCPAHPDFFIVGTYNLQKEEEESAVEVPLEDEEQQQTKHVQTRNGSLVVFQLTATTDITHVQTVLYPSAILDLHFHPLWQTKGSVIAVVSSTGTLSFFELSVSDGSTALLEEINTHRPLGDEEGILFLSCAWHPHIPSLLAITTSDYQVHILHVDAAWNVSKAKTEPVMTHTLEAWTVAFSPSVLRKPNPTTADSSLKDPEMFPIYSGGDDSKLLVTCCEYNSAQVGSSDSLIETPYPAITIKGHGAGVTAILPLGPLLSGGVSVVVTGSYDDHIRIYSLNDQVRDMPPYGPRLLAEQNLQGGVWRLRLVKLETNQHRWTAIILASCMHAGSRVLQVAGNTATGLCEIKVLGRFEEHKSMNYGSDFQPGSEVGGEKLWCVSTSFYDRLLCLWDFEYDERPYG